MSYGLNNKIPLAGGFQSVKARQGNTNLIGVLGSRLPDLATKLNAVTRLPSGSVDVSNRSALTRHVIQRWRRRGIVSVSHHGTAGKWSAGGYQYQARCG